MICSLAGVPSAKERRTWWVVGAASLTMGAELVVGYMTGSLALVADGWHMAAHVGAIALGALAYRFARVHALNARFAFGPGKVLALSGYTSAVVLVLAAIPLGIESIRRLFAPGPVAFEQAMLMAVIGLFVNIVCAWLLRPAHGDADHNARAAYLHIAADALTSVLAIAALCGGRFLGWMWLDSVTGLLGAMVVVRWGIDICRGAGRTLLDLTPSTAIVEAVRGRLERIDGCRVADLHVWEVAPGQRACIASIQSPMVRSADEYRAVIQEILEPGAHVTVEVRSCGEQSVTYDPEVELARSRA
jgi:cation diffusion facilitator family transporter